MTTTTPTPTLVAIDRADETLRLMQFSAERDDRFRDPLLAAQLAVSVATVALYRRRIVRERGA